MTLIYHLIRFWCSHPALFYGLSFLLGFYGAFESLLVFFPLFFLCLPFAVLLFQGQFCYFKPFILNLLIFFSAWQYGSAYYRFPEISDTGIDGIAQINIESVASRTTYFGKQWVYRCELEQFFPDSSPSDSIARGVKCTTSIPQLIEIQRPKAKTPYIISGTLFQTTGGYLLKVNRQTPWFPIEERRSLSEWRYQAKEWMVNFIQQHFSQQNVRHFLAGLITGEFDDRLMQAEFARFGLQHIMAISGFHFAILAGLLSFFLRLFFSNSTVNILLLLLLTSYFLFLGCSASIMRAWIMISIYLLGQCFYKQTKALNSLGVAIFIVVGIDPLLCRSIGFQFSFLTTAAILLCASSFDTLLAFILPKRPLSQMIEMNGYNQHGYCILSWFRQGLALTAAVNLLGWPLLLYHFQQFPIMSLWYNLFFPFCVSISMFLLLFGLLFDLIFPWLGQVVHYLNNLYTHWTLNLIYSMPKSIDVYYSIDFLPSWFLTCYLCLTFLGAIWLKSHLEEKGLEKRDLAYI